MRTRSCRPPRSRPSRSCRPSGLPWLTLLIAVWAALVAAPLSVGVRAQEGRKIWDGVYTEAQAARGKPAFEESCGRCHNNELVGSERGPALKGDGFIAHWENDSLDRLFTKIRDTMPQQNIESVTGQLSLLNGVPAHKESQISGGPESPGIGHANQVHAAARIDLLQFAHRSIDVGSFGQTRGKLFFADRLSAGKDDCFGHAHQLSHMQSRRGILDRHGFVQIVADLERYD